VTIVFMREIMQAAAEVSGIPVKALKGARRNRKIARVRQIACYLCRQLTTRSTTAIANQFGRDHTTVIHACRRIPELLQVEEGVPLLLEAIRIRAVQLAQTRSQYSWGVLPRVAAGSGTDSGNAEDTERERMPVAPAA
jgi:hypothetical protein